MVVMSSLKMLRTIKLNSRIPVACFVSTAPYTLWRLFATTHDPGICPTRGDSYYSTSTMACMRQIRIRRIEEADVQRGFFRVLSQLTEAPPLSTEQFGKLVRTQRELDVQLTLVAVKDEQVLGTGSVLIEPKFIRGGRPAGHIEDVVIDGSLRGKGVGKEIISRLVLYAKEKGCYKVVLDCGEYNVEFYEKCGMKQMGRQMAIYF